MTRRIPPDAFDYYASLGSTRSYQTVADHYGVSKRAVTKCARRESWQERLARIESQVRDRSDRKIADAIEEMNDRHLRTAKLLQPKALEALRNQPITSAMNAVRALDLGLRHERLIHGEPTDRTATQLEDVIKREYERWMISDGEDGFDLDGDLDIDPGGGEFDDGRAP